VTSISLMVVVNEMLKYKASEFTHLDCICRPSRARLHLFVTFYETRELRPGWYATALTLGEKVTHEFYGQIEKGGQVVITHWGAWEERLIFGKGKALFKDQIVDHSKSAMIVLHEDTDTFDMDHLSPIPVFMLKDAPGDYYLPDDFPVLSNVAGDILQKTVIMEGKTVTGARLLFAYQKVKKANEGLSNRNNELQREALDWHQKYIRGEEVNKIIKTEMHGNLSSKSDFKQAVVEQVTTLLEAHVKIRNALRELKPANWFTRALVTLILGVMCIGVFLMNPGGLMQWISIASNQMFIFMLVAVSAFGFFYWQSKKR